MTPICSQCGEKVYYGTLFCPECGAPFLEQGSTTQDLHRPGWEVAAEVRPANPGPTTAVVGVELHLPQGEKIALRGTGEWTLGRRSGTGSVDIDLTPYGGYEYGVSRMHAALRIAPDGVFVADLNSSNGTFLNGLRLRPHVPYPLHHQDTLMLGKLAIKIALETQPRR